MNYWKVWLDDGRGTMSSDTHLPEDVPVDGVIAVLQHWPDGQHEVLTGYDYLMWMGDMWVSGSRVDMDGWARKFMPMLKRGRWTSRAEFQAALSEANQDVVRITDNVYNK